MERKTNDAADEEEEADCLPAWIFRLSVSLSCEVRARIFSARVRSRKNGGGESR